MTSKEESTFTACIGIGIAHGAALACFVGAWLDDHGWNFGYLAGSFALLCLWGGLAGAMAGAWWVLRNRANSAREEGN